LDKAQVDVPFLGGGEKKTIPVWNFRTSGSWGCQIFYTISK